MKRNKMKNRFSVIEHYSFYAVRDNTTGEEHPMGDGVDTIFTKNDKALRPGSEYFRKTWQRMLNSSEDETEAAYFSHGI